MTINTVLGTQSGALRTVRTDDCHNAAQALLRIKAFTKLEPLTEIDLEGDSITISSAAVTEMLTSAKLALEQHQLKERRDRTEAAKLRTHQQTTSMARGCSNTSAKSRSLHPQQFMTRKLASTPPAYIGSCGWCTRLWSPS